MKVLFEISKEHNTIPKSEIFSTLNSEKINYKIEKSNEDILIIETGSNIENIKNLSARLSFTYYIDEFLFSCSIDKNLIKKLAEKNEILEKGTIAVKYKNRSKSVNSQPILKILADVYTKNKKV